MALRRAVVRDDWKLIQVSDEPDELFDLARDPLEMLNLMAEHPAESQALSQQLQAMTRQTETMRDNLTAGVRLDLEEDEQLMARLRGLGYIE